MYPLIIRGNNLVIFILKINKSMIISNLFVYDGEKQIIQELNRRLNDQNKNVFSLEFSYKML